MTWVVPSSHSTFTVAVLPSVVVTRTSLIPTIASPSESFRLGPCAEYAAGAMWRPGAGKAAQSAENRSYGSPPSHDPPRPYGAGGARSPFSVVSTVSLSLGIISILWSLALNRRSLVLGRAAAYQHMVPS
jgi:hypothetical protein